MPQIRLPAGTVLKGEYTGAFPSCSVAKYIVNKEEGEEVPNLGITKLLKLTYIAHGWLLGATRCKKSLIEEQVEAWQYGPVISDMYHALKDVSPRTMELPKKEDLRKVVKDYENIDKTCIEAKLIDVILAVYGKFHAGYLIELTHMDESPWDQTVRNRETIIPNTRIGNYYGAAF